MSNVAKLPDRDPPANDITAPHVLVAINAVMAEIGETGIAKDRKNQAQGYQFRGIDDVYNALAPILARNKLVITPRCLSRDCQERTSNKGGTLFYVTVDVEFDLQSAIDGSSKTARMFGEAMDSGDKATNKAMSAAYKYMAMQEFCIPTEGDNDADANTHEVSRRVPAAVEAAINLLRGCATSDLFKETWAKNFEGWKRVMDAEDYARVQAVKNECVAKFVADAEAEKARAAKAEKPVENFGIGEDEIPF